MNDYDERGPMVPLEISDGVTVYVESMEGEEQVSEGKWADFIGTIEPVVALPAGTLLYQPLQPLLTRITTSFHEILQSKSWRITNSSICASPGAYDQLYI